MAAQVSRRPDMAVPEAALQPVSKALAGLVDHTGFLRAPAAVDLAAALLEQTASPEEPAAHQQAARAVTTPQDLAEPQAVRIAETQVL
jgi:hypothetical protein